MLISELIAVAALVTAQPEPVPAAMVLATKGEVTLTRQDGDSRPARVMDILYVDDTLNVEGEARIVVLADGHKEKLTGEVTVTEQGASPDDRVTREPGNLSESHLAGLKKLARSGRGGVVVPRGDQDESEPSRTPMKGETLLDTRPSFSWADTEPPFGYVFTLSRETEGGSEQVWQQDMILEPTLEYPEDREPLERGTEYRWRVGGVLGGGDTETYLSLRFRVASEEEAAQAKELRQLAESDNPDDWLLAATTLDSMGMYNPARELFRKLVTKFPKEPAYLMALAAYYERSGDLRQAKAIVKEAESLRGDKDE